MPRSVTITATVSIRTADGCSEVLRTCVFPSIDVMSIGRTVERWVTSQYRKALKDAPRDVIVDASYRGQLHEPPFSFYEGALCGVNGKTMRQDGTYAHRPRIKDL